MKKFARKNQIIITALAVMIAVAGYLNFTGKEISKNGLTSTSATQSTLSDDVKVTEVPAEATDSAENKKTADAKGDYTVSDSGEVEAVSEQNPGEAVMVSSTLGAEYFASAKLNREQARAKNKEELMSIIDNDKIASVDKKTAINQVARMTKDAQAESDAEMMLQAKGFTDAVVSIDKDNVDVVVGGNNLTEQQIAQIEDIVQRKTSVAAENIVITPVAVETTTASPDAEK